MYSIDWSYLFFDILICQVEGKASGGQLEKWGGDGSLDLEDSLIRGEAGTYERHQMERRRLQAKQLHAERRKAWLRKNQALLRVFLSYCSLHGAKGGGVTSVRMELLFLLQESQQVCPCIPNMLIDLYCALMQLVG